jgi:hypothetical protein
MFEVSMAVTMKIIVSEMRGPVILLVFLRNIGKDLPKYTASHLRRQCSSNNE